MSEKKKSSAKTSNDVSLLKPGYRKAEPKGDPSVHPIMAPHDPAAPAFRGESDGGVGGPSTGNTGTASSTNAGGTAGTGGTGGA